MAKVIVYALSNDRRESSYTEALNVLERENVNSPVIAFYLALLAAKFKVNEIVVSADQLA